MCLFYPGPFHNHWEVEVAIHEWLEISTVVEFLNSCHNRTNAFSVLGCYVEE
jgi:hypothetical protein